MSSLEMVSYINSTRKPGEAEVLGKNFTAKMTTVPKEMSAKLLVNIQYTILLY